MVMKTKIFGFLDKKEDNKKTLWREKNGIHL